MKSHYTSILLLAATAAVTVCIIYLVRALPPPDATPAQVAVSRADSTVFEREIGTSAVSSTAAHTASNVRTAPDTALVPPPDAADFNDSPRSAMMAYLDAMTDTQYQRWLRDEVHKNGQFVRAAAEKVLDTDGDGTVSEAERRAGEARGRAMAAKVQQALAAYYAIGDDIESAPRAERKTLEKDVGTAFKTVLAETYEKYNFDPSRNDFPEGQRQMMVEESFASGEELMERLQNVIIENRSQSIGL